ncbi:DUF2905 domain-containing protein [Pseudobacteriovorax antillogorgiicola]|uniref:DUF2905 domain-containing protein n=1 Tax=Pseudobacteriovorax antillogorgiicola TaxID=1513793 RepID=A0A1Y6CHB7_9BACT|nr:DUF2905 domain-containing protein [Pseudobacteriovorax antillogorgiicola]TCS46934.1 DUF2905 family protein [Pseudobacteriovorax antillogorgiicola]SMF64340.1 Protein of unknown function [Pseudobacteriovorax antillogorgiicola]
MAKLMITAGCILILVGLVMHFGKNWGLGQLPGDISHQSGNFKLYIPITTSIIVSVALSLLLYLFRKIF